MSCRDTILKHLKEGTSVICDRYAYSGVAFTSSKGYDLEWCKHPDRGLPRPDAVLYLDLSIEDAKLRGGFGNEIYEREDMQRTVKDIYESKLFEADYWHRIPANTSSEQLHQAICEVSMKTIAAIPNDSQDLPLLWTSSSN